MLHVLTLSVLTLLIHLVYCGQEHLSNTFLGLRKIKFMVQCYRKIKGMERL